MNGPGWLNYGSALSKAKHGEEAIHAGKMATTLVLCSGVWGGSVTALARCGRIRSWPQRTTISLWPTSRSLPPRAGSSCSRARGRTTARRLPDPPCVRSGFAPVYAYVCVYLWERVCVCGCVYMCVCGNDSALPWCRGWITVRPTERMPSSAHPHLHPVSPFPSPQACLPSPAGGPSKSPHTTLTLTLTLPVTGRIPNSRECVPWLHCTAKSTALLWPPTHTLWSPLTPAQTLTLTLTSIDPRSPTATSPVSLSTLPPSLQYMRRGRPYNTVGIP